MIIAMPVGALILIVLAVVAIAAFVSRTPSRSGRSTIAAQRASTADWGRARFDADRALRPWRDDPSDENLRALKAANDHLSEAAAVVSDDESADSEPPSTTADPIDQIARLAELRDSGAVTSEEFEAKKAALLGRLR